jgi:integrase
MPARVKLLKISQSEVPFYEPHEYERLVEAAKSIGDHRLLVFVLLGGDAGLRCGEIIALEQTDVDLKRGVLHVRQSEWEGHLTLPKSGRGRKVVLTERLAAALAKNRHLRGPRVLWREESEGKVTQVLLAKWMRRLERRAGPKETGQLHILRHTFCSRLAMAGASTMAIKELAGPQQISTTQRYMHLSPAAKSAAIRLLDRGADRIAEDLKDTENRGDTVETERDQREHVQAAVHHRRPAALESGQRPSIRATRPRCDDAESWNRDSIRRSGTRHVSATIT